MGGLQCKYFAYRARRRALPTKSMSEAEKAPKPLRASATAGAGARFARKGSEYQDKDSKQVLHAPVSRFVSLHTHIDINSVVVHIVQAFAPVGTGTQELGDGSAVQYGANGESIMHELGRHLANLEVVDADGLYDPACIIE